MPLSSNTDFQRMSAASVEMIRSVVSFINHELEMNSFGVTLIVFARNRSSKLGNPMQRNTAREAATSVMLLL